MSKVGTLHFDQALSDISIAYRNAEFVAERVFPVVPVTKQSDKYFVYGKENFRVRDDLRAPGGEAKPSRWSLSNDSYFAGGHALKDWVPIEDIQNQDAPLDLLSDTTEALTEQILLAQESALVASLVAGMTSPSVDDLTSKKWDNNTYDPVAEILAQALLIRNRIGMRPNVFVCSASTWKAIRCNTNVKGLITGAATLGQALITPQQFATLIEVDEVLIAGSVYDAANEGQTASLGSVWGARALLFYRPPNPGRKTVSLGYTFNWNVALGQGAGNQFVKRYWWEPNSAWCIEVHKYYDQKLVTKDAGCLFTVCHS